MPCRVYWLINHACELSLWFLYSSIGLLLIFFLTFLQKMEQFLIYYTNLRLFYFYLIIQYYVIWWFWRHYVALFTNKIVGFINSSWRYYQILICDIDTQPVNKWKSCVFSLLFHFLIILFNFKRTLTIFFY